MRISDGSSDVCSSDLLAAQALIDLFDPLVGEDEHDAMLTRAPLDLRANRIKAGDDDLATLFPGGAAIPGAPDGWRSEESRGGLECVSQYVARWSPRHDNNNNKKNKTKIKHQRE